MIQQCNDGLAQFQNWSLSNKLSVNEEKTCCLTFSNRSVSCADQIQLNGKLLEFGNNYKFLGVQLDNQLKFNIHTGYIANKISKSIGILYRLKELVPKPVLIQLYNSLILPYFTYCITAWGGTFENHLYPLIKLQKRVLRIICKKPYREHTRNLFVDCNILRLKELYHYSLAIYVFKTKAHETFTLNHTYPTRNRNNMAVPVHRLTTTQHSVTFMGARIWNSLPLFIRTSASLSIFKKRLKKYYIESYLDPNQTV